MVNTGTGLLFWMFLSSLNLTELTVSITAPPLCSLWCVQTDPTFNNDSIIVTAEDESAIFLFKNQELCWVFQTAVLKYEFQYCSCASTFRLDTVTLLAQMVDVTLFVSKSLLQKSITKMINNSVALMCFTYLYMCVSGQRQQLCRIPARCIDQTEP